MLDFDKNKKLLEDYYKWPDSQFVMFLGFSISFFKSGDKEIGVAHDKNTYLHCVEEMLGIPDRLTEKTYSLTVKLESGELIKQGIRLCSSSLTNDISQRFRKYETAFRYRGAIRDGFIGNAPTQLCDAQIMKETVELIVERSNGADPLKDEFSIKPELYR